MTTPPRKKLVPLSLCLWKKKENVFLRPMMNKRPVRNSSCGGGRERSMRANTPPPPGRQGPGLVPRVRHGAGLASSSGRDTSERVTPPWGHLPEP